VRVANELIAFRCARQATQQKKKRALIEGPLCFETPFLDFRRSRRRFCLSAQASLLRLFSSWLAYGWHYDACHDAWSDDADGDASMRAASKDFRMVPPPIVALPKPSPG